MVLRRLCSDASRLSEAVAQGEHGTVVGVRDFRQWVSLLEYHVRIGIEVGFLVRIDVCHVCIDPSEAESQAEAQAVGFVVVHIVDVRLDGCRSIVLVGKLFVQGTGITIAGAQADVVKDASLYANAEGVDSLQVLGYQLVGVVQVIAIRVGELRLAVVGVFIFRIKRDVLTESVGGAEVELPRGAQAVVIPVGESGAAVPFLPLLFMHAHGCRIALAQVIPDGGMYGEADAQGRIFHRTEDESQLDVKA